MKKIEISVPDGHKEVITKSETGVNIEFVKVDKEKEMKEFIAPFLTNLTIFHKERTPDHVFYKQDGEVLFELYQNAGNRRLFVKYKKIWSVFENRFSLNYSDARSFIKDEVENALKLGSITPSYPHPAKRT
jgi:hypothetical protein